MFCILLLLLVMVNKAIFDATKYKDHIPIAKHTINHRLNTLCNSTTKLG
jgi:hypothetical protein